MHNDDAISRKSVIDVLTRNRVHFCDMVRITSELKELPTVTPKVVECEDAISRQAIKMLLGNRFMELQKRHDDKRYETNYCLNTILELPPVTPKQKMGRWIDYQKNIWIYAQCSECGTVHDTKTNYCPNCGAKMEGENE